MTFEQLAMFVAVAEREHLTKAAAAVGRTPSAVSASIKALETYYNVRLFHRVGRRIELTDAGRTFLGEAKATLARARSASLVLNELGALKRGTLDICASQTIGSYWLPSRLVRFHRRHPGIDIRMTVGNTKTVAEAVSNGLTELGFVEGGISEPALLKRRLAQDAMVVVVSPQHPLADATKKALTPAALIAGTAWVMREPGSGTRSEFEAALVSAGRTPSELAIAMVLPSNEAILEAVREGTYATAMSSLVAAPFIRQGQLKVVRFDLPPRAFMSLRHKDRHQSKASQALEALCLEPGEEPSKEPTRTTGASR